MFTESKVALGIVVALTAGAIQLGHTETYAEALFRLRKDPTATRFDYADAQLREVCRHPELKDNCIRGVEAQMKNHPYIEDNDFSHEDEAQVSQ